MIGSSDKEGRLTMYRDIRCEEADATAPRVGCGCRCCYMAREQALDPRLRTLTYERIRGLGIGSPSAHMIERPIMEYLAGRLDYGLLHIEIIRALLKFSDDLFTQQMRLVETKPGQHNLKYGASRMVP